MSFITRAWRQHREQRRAAKARAQEQWYTLLDGRRDIEVPSARPADIQKEIDAIREAARAARIRYGQRRVREAVMRYQRGWSGHVGQITSAYREPEWNRCVGGDTCCQCPKND